MSFNIYNNVIPNLASMQSGYNYTLATVVKSAAYNQQNAAYDMVQAICIPLNMQPTQYNGPDNCYYTLKNICGQAQAQITAVSLAFATVNNLISTADQCQAWFYPTASSVYSCNPVQLMTSTSCSTDSFVNGTNSSSYSGDTNNIVFNQLASAVDHVNTDATAVTNVTDNTVIFYTEGNPIVLFAPANNAELSWAMLVCEGNANNIYIGTNLCSDDQVGATGIANSISNNTVALCVGALLSDTPAWNSAENIYPTSEPTPFFISNT